MSRFDLGRGPVVPFFVGRLLEGIWLEYFRRVVIASERYAIGVGVWSASVPVRFARRRHGSAVRPHSGDWRKVPRLFCGTVTREGDVNLIAVLLSLGSSVFTTSEERIRVL